MPTASIEYLGGIDDKEKGVTLTGSATLLEIEGEYQKLKFLIDYGMFQGGGKDSEANKDVDTVALEANFLILTHAHLDHCGRLPLLVKAGYKNPIFMTELTKLQIFHILSDYVKIARENIDGVKSRNEKLTKLYRDNLFIKESYEKLKENGLKGAEKKKIQSKLSKLLNGEKLESGYKKAVNLLSQNGIDNNSDIQGAIQELPVLLYDEKDIENMMKLVQTLEIGGEKVLKDYMHITSTDPKNLDTALDAVKNGYDRPIYVDDKIKIPVQSMIKKRIEITDKAEKKNDLIRINNQTLHDELYKAFEFVIEEEGNNVIAKEIFSDYKKLLDEYSIVEKSDITLTGEDLYEVEFDLNVLYKAKKELSVKEFDINKSIIDAIKLKFLDAGHIEGSIQALITIVTQKIDATISQKEKIPLPRKKVTHKNFLFSGDLGRTRDPNLAGSPEISDLKLDFLQLETTYANRTHPEKMESVRQFFNAIKNAKGKIIIPCFSMQRTQEILVLLIEYLLEAKEELQKIIPLRKEVKIKEKRIAAIDQKESKSAHNLSGRSKAERNKLIIELKELKTEIIRVEDLYPIFDIVLDSPLSTEITNIYTAKLFEKYKLLSASIQKDLLGKQVVDTLPEKASHKKLYTDARRNKKEVVLSSSGMCQGGSVLNHLKENLQNPRSTIIFVGYCPDTTRGGLIKSKSPVVIDGEVFETHANVVDISGFSGHPDEPEIIDYIEKSQIAKNARVVLNHGTESRHKLAKKIETEIFKTRKNISVLVPSLNDKIEFKI